MTTQSFHIKQATTLSDLSSICALFTAYTAWLNIDLSFQNFAAELTSLPGLYAPPSGTLLLALDNESGEALGCVALRPLIHKTKSSVVTTEVPDAEIVKERICEMKRLYAVPQARGVGLGKALVERVLEEARRLGYEEMKLDTLEHMVAPIRLYERYGFERINAYYQTPLETTTVFLRKRLIGDELQGC